MRTLLAALMLPLLTLWVAPAMAHSYAPVADAALARRAESIIRGLIVAENQVLDGAEPYTEYVVTVAEYLKSAGSGTGGTVIVRVFGGPLADGSIIASTASPDFEPGEEVILFLQAERRGTRRIVEERLGAFVIEAAAGDGPSGAVAARRIGSPSGDAVLPDGRRWRGPRDATRFAGWLRRGSLNGYQRPADYFLPDRSGPRPQTAPFNLLQTNGEFARWASLDQIFRTTGTLVGEEAPGIEAAREAAAAWSAASQMQVAVEEGGGSGSVQDGDGINSIQFEDPGDFISGSFDCIDGGTLGETRTRIQLLPQEVGGTTFFTIIESDVVLQNGIECWLDRAPGNAAELIGHELGHAIGIDHSDILDALMFASAHGNGRGAQLHEDDVAALRALQYGEPPGPGEDPDVLSVLRKPRALQPRGNNVDLPLMLQFRTRDAATSADGPVVLYEIEIYERGSAAPLVTRTLRFGRDLDDTCAGARTRCAASLDFRSVSSKLQAGERYLWRVRASQGQPAVENNFSPWSRKRKFRLRR